MINNLSFSTVTLSPAIDVTLTVEKFPEPGDVLRGFEEVETPGGKGLNSARWLALRGHPVTASGIMGLSNADSLEAMMAAHGIRDAFIRVEGANRRNVMYTSPGGMFKMNRPAFPDLRPSDWSAERILEPCIAASRVCVLAGSLPLPMPGAVYADMIRRLRAAGVSAVLDTSGPALGLGLEAGPCVIKPNSQECAELLGRLPVTQDDFLSACFTLLEKAECVVLSDGPGGCWFANREGGGQVLHGTAPHVDVMDTTAAGDALLAEFCHGYFPLCALNEDTLRHACAAGAAATTMPGAASPPLALVERLSEEVVVRRVRR